jgi:hypothetical protein
LDAREPQDYDLEGRTEAHPESNWSETTRQAIEKEIEALEVMDELTDESEPTETGVREIADETNESGRERIDEESA